MSTVINLRRERKRRKLRQDAKNAETNRALFGRTKGQKLEQAMKTASFQRHVDSHKMENSFSDHQSEHKI